MKFLHISDLHIGKLLFEYSLLDDQRHWCSQVIDFLRNNKHDAVVIAGDLYDRSVPPAEAVELLDSFVTALVTELGLPVLAVSGNHDSGRRLGFASGLLHSTGLHIAATPTAEIAHVTLTDADGEVDCWLLPYLTPADVRNMLPDSTVHSYNDAYRVLLGHNKPRISPTRRNIIVAHGFFSMFTSGVDVAAVTSESEVTIGGMDIVDAAVFDGYDYCALGHLHAPQCVGGSRVRYSGSPLRYSVSEQHQTKTLLSVTLGAGGNVTTEMTTLIPLHQLYSVSGTIDELCAPTGGTRVSDDYVFVNIQTDGTEIAAAERVRTLYPNYLGLRYISIAEQEIILGGGDVRTKRTMADAFGDFFTGVTGRALTEDEQLLVGELATDGGEGQR